MTILRVPNPYPTIQAAVLAAVPGDTVLVEEGVYTETVTIANKSHIRVVAAGDEVILDGQNIRAAGFILTDSTGVEIKGFTIRNDEESGIQVSGGGFNRIVRNRVEDIGIIGVSLTQSTGNLVSQNSILTTSNTGIGVGGGGCTGNWIIGNTVREAAAIGVDILTADDRDNAVIGNRIFDNENNGLEAFGDNTFIYSNTIYRNRGYGLEVINGNDQVALSNEICDNRRDGILGFSDNTFIADNTLSDNGGAGVRLTTDADANVLQENEIAGNADNGILVGPGSVDNLIFRNELENNTPFDLNVMEPGNNDLLENDCDTSNPPGLCTD